MMTAVFYLNNFSDGGAKISDDAIKNYLSSRQAFNFHETIFARKFFKDVLLARNIVIMNFFSVYTLLLLFLLIFIGRKKDIYVSVKGQLMPHAIRLKNFKKSIFIFFIHLIHQT